MDKWQTLQAFWESFGIPAYDEQTSFTEGEEPSFPHITYEGATGMLDQTMTLSASLWYKSTSWADISKKANEILQYIATNAPLTIKVDNGYFWIKATDGTPFAQRVDSGNDTGNIKRIMMTVEAECLTPY